MAKFLLWTFFILHFLAAMLIINDGGEVSRMTTIIMWSSLGVLALCEAIETAGKHQSK